MLVAQILRYPSAEFAAQYTAKQTAHPRVRRNTAQFSTREMLRTPHFYLLYAMFVTMATGGLLATAQAGPVAQQWGISRTALTAALALDRISNGASRVAWGWISDHIGRETTMSLAFILQAGCLLSVLVLGRLSGTLFTVTLIYVFHVWRGLLDYFHRWWAIISAARMPAPTTAFSIARKAWPLLSVHFGGIAI